MHWKALYCGTKELHIACLVLLNNIKFEIIWHGIYLVF